jgi:hypothetical protein
MSEEDYDFDVPDTVARMDFDLRNNADWRQPFKVNNYDPNSFAATPFDLTGATLRMQWRDPNTQAVAFELSTVNGRLVITDAVNGFFVTAAKAADLFAIPAGFYQSDLVVIKPDSTVELAMIANINLSQGDTVPAIPTF